jgi:hypothetical protein
MFGLAKWKRMGQLEDEVRDLRARVSLLEQSEVTREASTASATLTLRRLNDRLRKQVARAEALEDPDGNSDDELDEVSAQILRSRFGS